MPCPCSKVNECPRLGFNLMVYRDPCSIDLSKIPADTVLPEGTAEPIEPAAKEAKPYPWWILALLGVGVYYLDQQG